MLLTTLLPYSSYIFPFIPNEIFGFNLTGWAWMILLLATLPNLLKTRSLSFPIIFWLPWILYMFVYLALAFSLLGLQLTLQYTLPVLVGVVASGFSYTLEDLEWLFKWFVRLCFAVYSMFLSGYLFRGGYTPAAGATPMLLTVALSLLASFWFLTKEKRYLFYAGIIFLAPIVDITRMGIVVMSAVFILHFANRNLLGKIIYGLLGLLVLLIVFNTKGFQEKTFYNVPGKLSDLALNYYDNPNINSSGRSSWKMALEPGLKAEPLWGNGPRADNYYLTLVTGQRVTEAHNDYLSVRFNYGYVGLALLLLAFLLNFISLYRKSLKYIEDDFIFLLSTSSLTLFFGFLMFMYSDNILKYTIYFPNYFFALIGIVYSLIRDEDFSCRSAL